MGTPSSYASARYEARPSLGGSSSLATLQRAFDDGQPEPTMHDNAPRRARPSEEVGDARDNVAPFTLSPNTSMSLSTSQKNKHQDQLKDPESPRTADSRHLNPYQSFQPDMQQRKIPSPAFSIDAVSESDDDMMSTLIRTTKRNIDSHSPRIGDLTWSSEETGPFGVAGVTEGARSTPYEKSRGGAGAAALATSTSMQRGDSFDLNMAIADLLHEDENRRKARRAAGFESASPETISRVSADEEERSSDPTIMVSRAPVHDTSVMLTPQQATVTAARRRKTSASMPSDESGGMEGGAGGESSMITPRRTRNGSSSGAKISSTAATASVAAMARLPSSASAQSVRHARRSSSASIGQSLLRGSLPLGAAEEYEGRLSGGDDAAEALRKLDGLGGTPRASRVREQSRSPRSSKQLSRPGSAGHRTPSNVSRGSSPSGRSTVGVRHQREDSASRTTAARRASRTIASNTKSKAAGVDDLVSPALHAIDSPRRVSLSSPRTRRSQLPPLPSASAVLPAGLSTPPSVALPLAATNSSTNLSLTNPRRASGASLASSASIGAPRTSTSTRSKRGSDISLADLQQHNGNPGLGLTHSSDEHHIASSVNSANALAVPPVPPLPKAWESSRSMNSIVSEALGGDQPVHSLSQTLPQPRQRPPSGDSSSQASIHDAVQMQKSTSSKWSLTNLSTTLNTKKSDDRLASQKTAAASTELAGGRGSVTAQSALRHEQRAAQSSQQIQPSSVDDKAFRGKAGDSSYSFTVDSNSSSSLGASNTPASMSVARMSSEQSLPSPSITTSSPKARRTPSFFRKRSSEVGGGATAEDVVKRGKKSPSMRNLESHATPRTPQASAIPESSSKTTVSAMNTRSDTLTPSGRSSRKSILGLGNLLRSTSKRNIDSMPTSLPTQHPPAHKLPSSDGVGDDSLSSYDSSNKSKGSSALSTMRRASLMGRKRGKTLPSSNDAPLTPAQQLPPIQVPPLAEPPLSPPRKREGSVGTNAQSLPQDSSTGERRRLTNSNSTGDLTASIRDKNFVSGLPTINASPSTVVSTTSTTLDDFSPAASVPVSLSSKRTASAGMASENGVPASRIPRATTLSVKRQTLAASQSSSFVRRLSGVAGGLPSSKTSASLASHLGISTTSPSTHDASSDTVASTGGDATAASSSSLVSILNAYTNAKTPAEVDAVLRQAKLASYSSAFSPREKEVLISLVSRQEERKRSAEQPSSLDGDNSATESVTTIKSSNFSTPQIHRTHREYDSTTTPQHPRVSSTNFSTSVGSKQFATPSTLSSLSSSVPAARKARASMTAVSNAARTARDATSQMPTQTASRLSTPSSARASPALSDMLVTRSSSTASPSTSSIAADEEEREGDEEIEAYIQRRHARKVAQGARLADLEKLLEFPDAESPSKAYSYRQAEALWGDKLTRHELDEIRAFKEIYFVGQSVDKNTRVPSDGTAVQNNGYDDERGDYLVINHDHLAYRYEVMSLLGRGSFGQVLQCKDHKTGKFVAIKLIRNKRRFHHQALVEVKILENLVKWDPHDEFHVIKILDSFYFRNHLCISTELLSINLYELIKANSFAGFSTKLIRRVTGQVLASLSLLRRNRVVHCDLKPENILLRHPRKSGIKVIDFGSSCFEHEKVYTYIQSRFYRSPEVILGMNYHTAIDIWSLGCIIAELYSGYPLFPGENEQEQLACIMEILGVPDRYLVDRSSRKKLFFDSTGAPRPVVNSKGKRRRPNTKTLGTALSCNEELFLDFLSKCLHWDPERRIKPDAALRHPWIKRGGVVQRPEAILSSVLSSGGVARRTSMLPSSGSTSTVTSNGLTPRRTLASSTTTSSLASHNKPPMSTSMSASVSTSKISSNITPGRHERRISLRSSVNANGSSSLPTSDATEPVKQAPLRASRRSQQPVQ